MNIAIKSGSQNPEMTTPNLNMGTYIINPADDRTYYIEWTKISEMLGVSLSSAGYIGVALTTTVPVSVGFVRYLVSSPGTYTNFKDASNASLVVSGLDITGSYVEFWGTNGVFTKQVLSVDLTNVVRANGQNLNEALSTINMFPESEPGVFFTDELGKITAKIDNDGLSYFGQVKQEDLQELSEEVESRIGFIIDDEANAGKFSIADENGNVAFQISETGIVNYNGKGSGGGGGGTGPIEKPNFISDYFQLIVYGQSLSVGGSFTLPLDLYDSKTYQGGILTNYDPDVAGAANTYFGSSLKDLPKTGTETPGKGMARILKDLILSENQIPINEQNFTPVVNAPGTGGASWTTLSNTSGKEYRRLLESVRRGKDFAMALNKTYSVPVLAYIQGENSGDKAKDIPTWYANLESLFDSLNENIKAITGQEEDVQFITYQIASFPQNPPATVNVPLAQLKIALEKENVHFGCAMYQFEYADALHGTATTYRLMGASMGVVAKRAIVDKKKMQPIKPLSWSIQVNTAADTWVIKMKMNVPVPPLVIDQTVNSRYITIPEFYGFSIMNAGAEVIKEVTISHGDTINIFCKENPDGLFLRYAFGGRDSGGNIRDSQGDAVKINCEGVTQRVDNWCPIFEQQI